jgi:DNA-binding NtrC family response regulator
MKKEDPELKAIVATGYPNSEVRSAMERGELHDVFIKPYEVDIVLKRVSELTRSSSSHRENEPKAQATKEIGPH